MDMDTDLADEKPRPLNLPFMQNSMEMDRGLSGGSSGDLPGEFSGKPSLSTSLEDEMKAYYDQHIKNAPLPDWAVGTLWKTRSEPTTPHQDAEHFNVHSQPKQACSLQAARDTSLSKDKDSGGGGGEKNSTTSLHILNKRKQRKERQKVAFEKMNMARMMHKLGRLGLEPEDQDRSSRDGPAKVRLTKKERKKLSRERKMEKRRKVEEERKAEEERNRPIAAKANIAGRTRGAEHRRAIRNDANGATHPHHSPPGPHSALERLPLTKAERAQRAAEKTLQEQTAAALRRGLSLEEYLARRGFNRRVEGEHIKMRQDVKKHDQGKVKIEDDADGANKAFYQGGGTRFGENGAGADAHLGGIDGDAMEM